MPEETEDYYRVPNPHYSGQDWSDSVRTITLSAANGIKGLLGALSSTGKWKIRTLLFEKAKWEGKGGMDACQTWVKEHKDGLRSVDVTTPAQQGFRALPLDERRSGFGPRPDDDDLARINAMALEPLTAEDVYVRRMGLANDQVHRGYWTRFSQGNLRRLAEGLPGKAVLIGHDHHSAPIGRFYKAEVRHDPGSKWTWLDAYWYAPVTQENEHDRRSIDSGVWSDVSIGFVYDSLQCDLCGGEYMTRECPHVLGAQYPVAEARNAPLNALVYAKTDESQIYATATFRGDTESREGSIVYLASVPDAAILRAQLSGDLGEAKRLMMDTESYQSSEGVSDIESGEQAALQTQTGRSEGSPGEAAIQETQEANTMATEMETRLAEATTALDAARAQLTERDAKLEELTASVGALRGGWVQELIELGTAIKRDPELRSLRASLGENLAGMSDEALLALVNDWRKALEASVPGTRQSSADTTAPKTGEQTAERKAAPGLVI